MKGIPPACLFPALLLVLCMVCAGCSEESPQPLSAVSPLTRAVPRYTDGDIVATPQTAASSPLVLILEYDSGTDEYTKALIEKNADGTWGYRTSGSTETGMRAQLEKVYTVRVAHVSVASIPVITPAIPGPSPSAGSTGRPPSITAVSPDYASRGTAVTLTVTGKNFQEGATVRLIRAGSSPVTATDVTGSGSSLTCVFNLNGRSDGSYSLVVTNPDGQSDVRQGIFTIGEALPVITSIYPPSGILSHRIPVAVYGQNFRTNVKVSFSRGNKELVCLNPVSRDGIKITCDLDLGVAAASAGEWNVTVLNIDSQTKGTWIKKFNILNATAGGS